MTIAAGFRCVDGIVLAADTRIEDGDVKRDEKKILRCCALPGCSVLLTGGGDFEAISACAELLQTGDFFEPDSPDSINKLKKAIRKFIASESYTEMLEHPDTGDFTCFIGLMARDGQTDVVGLSAKRMYPITSYRCYGSGSEAALFLAKWLYRPAVPTRLMKQLAIQIVRASKGHHAGVGGNTNVVALTQPGDLPGTKWKLENDAELLWGIPEALGSVIYGCIDPTISQEEFKKYLTELFQRIYDKRMGTLRWHETITALEEGREPRLDSIRGPSSQLP